MPHIGCYGKFTRPHGEPRMPDMSADTLSDNAKSYTAAASRLRSGGGLDSDLAPAFYLLISFALELLLKAVCMRDGATPD